MQATVLAIKHATTFNEACQNVLEFYFLEREFEMPRQFVPWNIKNTLTFLKVRFLIESFRILPVGYPWKNSEVSNI